MSQGKLTTVTAKIAAYPFLGEAIEREVECRRKTEHARPMPSTAHNIAFAQSEMAGEVLDAIMRSYPEYVRNNGKDADLAMEIGDAFSQIASAMITLEDETVTFHADITQYLAAKVSIALANAQVMWQVGSGIQASLDLQEAASWLLQLCCHLAIDPMAALERSHQKTMAKHARQDHGTTTL